MIERTERDINILFYFILRRKNDYWKCLEYI